MKRIELSACVILLVVLCFSCGTEKCISQKKGGTTVLLSLTEDKIGSYVIEQRSTSIWVPLDTLVFEEGTPLMFNIEVSKKEIISVKKIGQQGELVFIADNNENIKIAASGGNLQGTFRLSGTEENNSLDELVVYERSFQQYVDSLNKVYTALKKQNQHYAIESTINELYKKRAIEHEDFVKSFIDKKPTLFVNVLAVRSLDVKRYPKYYKKVMASLLEYYPTSEHVIHFSETVGKAIASEVGGVAPEISLMSNENKLVKLSDFKGKYVLLDFWATWCRPCIAEIPNLKNVHAGYAGADFEIISVCIDRATFKENWKKIIDQYQMSWPQLFDETGTVANDFGITHFPTIILLNKKGEIIAKNIRGEEIGVKVKEAIQKDK